MVYLHKENSAGPSPRTSDDACWSCLHTRSVSNGQVVWGEVLASGHGFEMWRQQAKETADEMIKELVGQELV